MLLTVSLFFVIWSQAIYVVRMLANAGLIRPTGPDEFWISVNLLNVEWKGACLTSTYCNQPELKMIKTNSVNGEKSSFSWQLDENLQQSSDNAFISHWTKGSPMDIEVSIEITGTDPKYRFQRSCDQTAATKAFENEVQEEQFENSSAKDDSDLGQMILELRGRCFNATLTVQKHIARCPWCGKSEATSIATATQPCGNGFSSVKQFDLLVIACIITSCLTIVCSVQCILNLCWKSGRLLTRKTPASSAAQSKSWKIMKIHGDDRLIRNTMSGSKNSKSSSNDRITFNKKSLINSIDSQIFMNSDTMTESDRPSSFVSAATYDNVALSDDLYEEGRRDGSIAADRGRRPLTSLPDGVEDDNMKKEFEKEDDSEKSISSNDDFEIIGGQSRMTGHDTAGDDGKSNDPFMDLFKKHVVKRHVSTPPHDSQGEGGVGSAMLTLAAKINNNQGHSETQSEDDCSCILWKMLFIVTIGIIVFQFQLLLNYPEEIDRSDEALEEMVIRQQHIIEKLENQLNSCAPLDAYNLRVRIEEERANAFERRDGFSYLFVIVDWKKSDRGIAQQHLHLAFKQSNSSIYVYDHGPLSGKYFTVGDRIIDIDGIKFIRAADLRDRILWSHHNKDHFTSIIERPATEQTIRAVSTLLQPSLSSFSVVLSA
ncbi:unnamed protein product [Litomosoides sigmodontis]|uniref:C2 domain-containing protein n=1 Tax=Litomosoides sigmodontis TaxID=42156 RepID=A0A3P6SXP0_LITSI|nr:unnamed protein product [Litomosoides sigmodontis]